MCNYLSMLGLKLNLQSAVTLWYMLLFFHCILSFTIIDFDSSRPKTLATSIAICVFFSNNIMTVLHDINAMLHFNADSFCSVS